MPHRKEVYQFWTGMSLVSSLMSLPSSPSSPSSLVTHHLHVVFCNTNSVDCHNDVIRSGAFVRLSPTFDIRMTTIVILLDGVTAANTLFSLVEWWPRSANSRKNNRSSRPFVFIRVIRGQKPLRLRLMAGTDARVPTTNNEPIHFQRSVLTGH